MMLIDLILAAVAAAIALSAIMTGAWWVQRKTGNTGWIWNARGVTPIAPIKSVRTPSFLFRKPFSQLTQPVKRLTPFV